MDELTHFKNGKAVMVNVNDKEETKRKAVAQAIVKVNLETFQRIMAGTVDKGDVLSVARIAGIMGAKQTSNLIPMCHPIFISSAEIDFELIPEKNEILILSTVETFGKTGIEMEAITAVTISAITIYDMCKAIDKSIEVNSICLLKKTGGKSGVWKKE